jgi:hydroxypyruvate isomerase
LSGGGVEEGAGGGGAVVFGEPTGQDAVLGVLASEVVTPAMWLQAARTLTRLAELGERAGRVFTLETLNTAVDHPGTPFAKADDTSPWSRPAAARTCG